LRFPTILSRVEDGDTRVFELDISDELIWFRGHFPGFPVLPGVVQLQWAVQLTQENFGLREGPQEILRLKFKSIIVPPVTVELTLSQLGPCEARFEYTGQGQTYSQGRLRFTERAQ